MTDWQTWTGHGILATLILWLMQGLRRHGVKFSIHIWKNGKDKESNDDKS